MASSSLSELPNDSLKDDVRQFWNSNPCGSRYLQSGDNFETHARARYSLEPHISGFAQFASAQGLKVLEVGVGMGADYLEWLKAGALVTGVDLSSESIERARRRAEICGFSPDLHVADAEHLPFPDNSFDILYSYGVMHHSPHTAQCLTEALRVLKPRGQARIMIYHHASLVGIMLWLRYGLLKGKSLRRTVYDHLESPGTKTYTHAEAHSLMSEFSNVSMRQVFSPGDLLLNQPSARFRSPIYRWIWRLYPRWLMEKLAHRLGLFLLISATKS